MPNMDSHMGKISPTTTCAAWKKEQQRKKQLKCEENVIPKSGVENTTGFSLLPQMEELLKIGFMLTV